MKKNPLIRSLILIIIASLAVILITTMCFKKKNITLNINGEKTQVVTYKRTVKDLLKREKIILGPKDSIKPALEEKLADNDTIILKRAVNVKVEVDGNELKLQSSEDNIESLLKAEGISLKSEDKIKPDKETKLAEGLEIDIIRVTTKTLSENIQIKFKDIVQYNKSIPNTKRKTIQEGKDGEKQITSQITYEDGKEVSRKIISETVVKKPLDKIVMQGTYPLMPVSRGGQTLPYSKVIKVRSTAYWAVRGVGKTYTASGRKAIRNPDGYSTISVDPQVIPYGTKVFVEKYGFAIAADTGTSIKGNKVDVFFNTYQEACNWAVKYVNVYILK